MICLGVLVVLMLAWPASIVQAQATEQQEPPSTPSGQAGSMPGQGGMQGMQGGMGQMTWVWPEGASMRAMQTPLGRALLMTVGILGLLLLVTTNAALIGLTLFLVRRSRVGRPLSGP